ncbi:MAG: N-acetyltransferase [Phycisphaerae bacterium]|nr:N-acetyltransferase [Phycisphaerae bacterium]
MLIRPIRESDFEPVAALTNIYIRDTAIHFAYDPVTAAELRELWTRQRDTYPWLAAEVDGAFAGYAKAGPWRERAAYKWTPEVGIYIEPRVHRRGVGKALYARLLECLRAQGYRSAIGGITLPNAPSVALHEALGFVKISHVARAGWKLNRWWDVGFWQVMLGAGDAPPRPIVPPPG